MRIALGVEYDGSKLHGWQKQNDVVSVQEHLEKALSVIANHPVNVICAGRTDAGVHGTGQVVHFDTDSERKLVAWTLGVNANLPSSIAVCWAHNVSDEFHARFTATARRYRYIIYNNTVRPGILASGVSHYHTPLNEHKMHEAAQCLLGEHDFTSFRATHCQAHSPWRSVMHLNVTRQGQYVVVDVKANAFLHHMVRNIVGSLIKVGAGEEPPEWIQWVLDQKDRRTAGTTAKPGGLYLVDVDYPISFELPRLPIGPHFFPAD
ncbi:tRNA pseudouridine(38-40) synthase TruA [Vibrio casei]|uniref:tRNA pseudouridine synthase A n=1 Tax=Vibrio casei TaxID=673372 RepID=A0A368LQ28_9VIBR|nr:tRNA pseudouridine(38-40) synthase TruA [Vibrio casei]RCS73593.1 tRNA pseudouridine(38-40) synthase TruA [Vibrio casei]SJN31117.1 tRNA pseudouridine synthase A [Vibrio casei]